MQDRQRKRGSFSGSCLCATEQIARLQDMRNSLDLNGCGNGVTLGGNRAKDGLSEPQICEFHVESDFLESRSIRASGGLAPGSGMCSDARCVVQAIGARQVFDGVIDHRDRQQ